MDFRGFQDISGGRVPGLFRGFLKDVGNVSRRFEIFQGPSVEFKVTLWCPREVF